MPATPLPTPYTRQTSFTDWEANHPGEPAPGTSLDAEFNAVQVSITDTQARLAQIQRDDGRLADASVGPDQLDDQVIALIGGGFVPRGAWAPFTKYDVGDAVEVSGSLYAAVVKHVSAATFAADQAAGYWMFISQSMDAADIVVAPIPTVPGADTVQEALEGLAVGLTAQAGALAGLTTDLADQTNPTPGAMMVGLIGPEVGEVGMTLADANLQVFNPRRWGCVGDGVNNDSIGFRKMLDAIPSTGGLIRCQAGKTYYLPDVVYIPQRIPAVGVAGAGIVIEGNNCTFKGSGANTIFESGTGTKSTVALGGATNFGLGNELPTTIHYNSRIVNCNFKDCGDAIRVFNWLHGCLIEKCYAANFTGRMLWAKRCFYLGLRDVQGRPFRADRGLTPIIQCDEANNTQSFVNVHCSGIKPDGTASGVGLQLDGGVQGLVLGPGGVSFEGCTIGLWLKSVIYSLTVLGVYFELCGTAIQTTGANLLHVIIDGNEFEDCPIDISVDNWIDGYYGAANKNEGTVTFGTGCVHEVRLPAQYLTQAAHTTWIKAPAGWTIPAGCQVRRNDMIYNSAGGLSSVWFRNEPDSGGNTGIAPMKYTGDCFNIGGTIPYVTVTLTTGVITLDTKIAWNPNLASVRFDINVIHSQNDTVSGWVTCNNLVRLDAGNPAGITVVASNNGGFLRIAMSGFSVAGITGYSGKVRIV